MPRRDKIERTTQSVYARHGIGGTWWLGFIVVPLVIAGALTATRHTTLQDDLRADSLKALSAHGLNGVDVSFNGRNAKIGVPIWMDQNRPRTIVQGVDGVSSVLVDDLDAGNPYGLSDCAKPQIVLNRIVGSGVRLTGDRKLPAASVRKLRRTAQLVNACDQLGVRIDGTQARYLKAVLENYHIETNRVSARVSGSGSGSATVTATTVADR